MNQVKQTAVYNPNILQSGTVFQGDCLKLLKKTPDKSIDAIITDPPWKTDKKQNKGDATEYDDHWTWSNVDPDELEILADKCPDAYEFIRGSLKQHRPYLTMMAVRLYHCHRILKDTGSLMLMCDSEILGQMIALLQHIFGSDKRLNNIISYEGNKGNSSTKNKCSDNKVYILWFTKTNKFKQKVSIPQVKYSEKELEERLKKNSNYQHPVTGEWGTIQGATLVASKKSANGHEFTWKGLTGRYKVTYKQMLKLESENRIGYTSKGTPYRFYPAEEMKPTTLTDHWVDINAKAVNKKIKRIFPTAKSAELLERLIQMITKENDIILDPFAGSGITGSTAAILNRKWILCDLKKETADCVTKLLAEDMFVVDQVKLLTDDDIDVEEIIKVEEVNDKPIITSLNQDQRRRIKEKLYREVEGCCQSPACGKFYPIGMMDLDHKTPRVLGGSDDEDNLQILCRECNLKKGALTNEEFTERQSKLQLEELEKKSAKEVVTGLEEDVARLAKELEQKTTAIQLIKTSLNS